MKSEKSRLTVIGKIVTVLLIVGAGYIVCRWFGEILSIIFGIFIAALIVFYVKAIKKRNLAKKLIGAFGNGGSDDVKNISALIRNGSGNLELAKSLIYDKEKEKHYEEIGLPMFIRIVMADALYTGKLDLEWLELYEDLKLKSADTFLNNFTGDAKGVEVVKNYLIQITEADNKVTIVEGKEKLKKLEINPNNIAKLIKGNNYDLFKADMAEIIGDFGKQKAFSEGQGYTPIMNELAMKLTRGNKEEKTNWQKSAALLWPYIEASLKLLPQDEQVASLGKLRFMAES